MNYLCNVFRDRCIKTVFLVEREKSNLFHKDNRELENI